jgi:hypothetical protein
MACLPFSRLKTSTFIPGRMMTKGYRMLSKIGLGWLSLALALLVPVHAGATTLLFNDFSSTAGLQLNGSTAAINTGGQGTLDFNGDRVLRLTNDLGQAGSAFSTTAISLDSNASFSTRFNFRITDQQNGGADGLVFVVQTVSNTAGGGGGGIGYIGLNNSVGIEFDNWFNSGFDPDDNHAGIDLNGNIASSPVVNLDSIAQLDAGDIWTAWVDYNGATQLLEVRANITGVRPLSALMSTNVNLVSVLGSTDAFVGFTSGTGAAGGDHDILSWEFRSSFAPIDAPEPASVSLIGLGLIGLALRRRGRRS